MRIIILILFTFSLSTSIAANSNVNNTIPFSLKTIDGKTIDLAQLQGKVVYLDFWATWCGPCRKSFPWMNTMHKKYQADDLEIIAVSLDFDKESVIQFLDKIPANFAIALDPSGSVADKYNVQVMPTSYLINRQGQIIFQHKGFLSKDTDELEEKFKKALKNP